MPEVLVTVSGLTGSGKSSVASAPMAYDYIRKAYGVDFKPGERIAMDGKLGVIVRPRNDPQYLRVRFDGTKHVMNVHPTWQIKRLPARA